MAATSTFTISTPLTLRNNDVEDKEVYQELVVSLRNGFSCCYKLKEHSGLKLAEAACCMAWFSFYADNGSLPLNKQTQLFECVVKASESSIEPVTLRFKVDVSAFKFISTATVRFFQQITNECQSVLELDFSTSRLGNSLIPNEHLLLKELKDNLLMPFPTMELKIDDHFVVPNQPAVVGVAIKDKVEFLTLLQMRNGAKPNDKSEFDKGFIDQYLVDFLNQCCIGLTELVSKGYNLSTLHVSDFGFDIKNQRALLTGWRKLQPLSSLIVMQAVEPNELKRHTVIILAQLIFVLSGKFSSLINKKVKGVGWEKLELDPTTLRKKLITYLKSSSPNWTSYTSTDKNTPLSAHIRVSGEISSIDSLLILSLYMLNLVFLSEPDLSLITLHLEKIKHKYWQWL